MTSFQAHPSGKPAPISPRRAAVPYVNEIAASIPILPYDEAVANHHATLLVAVRREGRPSGTHDLVVGATAAAAGRTVVSADRRAFDGLPGVQAVDLRHP